MSSPPIPTRPRLADHVLARRHVVDGQPIVVLHDTKAGRLVQVGPREWGLLAAADGTRDLEGVVLAAARDGSFARVPALRAFLEQLHLAGMLEDGVGASEPEPIASSISDDTPLDPLPGFSLACDGRGSCCRVYASILFAPLEAARARAARPDILDGGARHRHVFLPERGSGPCAASAVTLVDGRCAYLEADGRCSIHAVAGEAAKPLGCRLFPATFTYDGEAVRVSVAVECACVFASAEAGPGLRGAPLIADGARSRADLDPSVFIAELPALLRISGSSPAEPRAAAVAWSRSLLAELDRWDGAPRSLFSLAAAVEADGLDDAARRRAIEGRGPSSDARDVLPWIEALRDRAARRANEDAAYRGERDCARVGARWIEAAAASLLEAGACEALVGAAGDRAPDGGDPSGVEAFYLRALLHGHHLLADDRPLAGSIRDRGVRLLVARAMSRVAAQEGALSTFLRSDPALRFPLAALEAMLRGHGLESYRNDVDDR